MTTLKGSVVSITHAQSLTINFQFSSKVASYRYSKRHLINLILILISIIINSNKRKIQFHKQLNQEKDSQSVDLVNNPKKMK